jgi:mannose-6-phosphate isomerase-like protein (cupin superfamily)
MNPHRYTVFSVSLLVISVGSAYGQEASSEVIALKSENLEWKQASIGWEMATLFGDMSSNDTSIVRLRMPPNWDAPPHTHNRTELEVVSVQSGMLHLSFGENVGREDAQIFGPGAFIAYPAGTTIRFFTEDEVVVIDVYHLRNPAEGNEEE